MKTFFKKLLSSSGEVSAMRLMSLWSLIIGSVVALYGVYKGKDLSGLAQVCGVFIGAAFAAKTVQKFVEKKDE